MLVSKGYLDPVVYDCPIQSHKKELEAWKEMQRR